MSKVTISKSKVTTINNPFNEVMLEIHYRFVGIFILNMKRLTTGEFIEKAKLIHGDKYDYSKSIYTFSRDKLTIICLKHGEFVQNANNHLSGKGCNKCFNKFNNLEEFIDYSNNVHNNFYNYEKVVFINTICKVKIICPEHGIFEQTPYNHIMGKGCRECGNIKTSIGLLKNQKWFVIKANGVHSSKYDYSKSTYVGIYNRIEIICREHGIFEQSPNDHLQGKGCPKCAGNYRYTNEDFINKVNIIHNNKYDYTQTVYINNNKKIKINCYRHGVFLQIPHVHIGGRGCPKCGHIISKPELELSDFIKSLNLEILTSKRNIIKPYELDIYIPSLKKAIEFNGMYWHYNHSNKNCKPKGYHAMKSNLCKEQGIRLLHIREDLWNQDKNKMKSVIQKFLKTFQK